MSLKYQAKVIHGFSVGRTGIVGRLTADCLTKMLGSFVIFSCFAKKDTDLSISPDIRGITSEDLIVHRIGTSLMELKVAHPYIVQFFCILYAFGIRIYGKKILWMRLAEVMPVWVIVNKKFSRI